MFFLLISSFLSWWRTEFQNQQLEGVAHVFTNPEGLRWFRSPNILAEHLKVHVHKTFESVTVSTSDFFLTVSKCAHTTWMLPKCCKSVWFSSKWWQGTLVVGFFIHQKGQVEVSATFLSLRTHQAHIFLGSENFKCFFGGFFRVKISVLLKHLYLTCAHTWKSCWNFYLPPLMSRKKP